jgi:tetratricopeptide (TPR) repeat protein
MAAPSSADGPYSLRDLRSLYPAVTERHLRYLEQWGLLRSQPGPRERREYSFADLTTVRQLATELDRGVPLRAILRTLSAGRTGQRALDFHDDAAASPARVVPLEPRRQTAREGGSPWPAAMLRENSVPGLSDADPQAALAAKYFLEAAALDDGADERREAAAAAYRKALVIWPDLVPAVVNLANIHYACDEMIEAQALYERAIALDPHCFEAHFNLGNIHHDLGRYEQALVAYREAVGLNPVYADAHFYLAVTLEKTGRSAEARPHWKSYQELAPDGEWVDLAKEFTE